MAPFGGLLQVIEIVQLRIGELKEHAVAEQRAAPEPGLAGAAGVFSMAPARSSARSVTRLPGVRRMKSSIGSCRSLLAGRMRSKRKGSSAMGDLSMSFSFG